MGLDSTDTTILVLGGFGLIYIAWKTSLQYVNWIDFGIKVATILISTTIFCFIIYFIFRFWRKKKAERLAREELAQQQENQLLEALDTRFSWLSSDEALEKFRETKKLIVTLPDEITFKHEEQIYEFYSKTEKLIQDKEEQERQRLLEKQEKQKAKESEKQEFERQVKELVEFKKAEKSRHALPLKHNYSVYVIQEAEMQAESNLRQLQIAKMIRNDAIEYYKTHGLHTKPKVPDCFEEIYTEVRKGITEGKIPLKAVIENSGTPLEKKFYRAKGLSEDIKNRAAAQGYEYVKGVELDGKPCAGGFYIKKTLEKESNHHFITKYLFAELRPKIQIEHCIDGKRVDAAYISKQIRLGIEVETGSNKDEQLAAKSPWLNKNFTNWIFVCPRKEVARYSKLVDNEKSYCLTPKKAKEKILDLIAPMKQR